MTGIKLLPTAQAKQLAAGALQQGQVPQQAAYDVQCALKKPTWEEVIKLLRDQPRRRFSIDIETDSIVAPDDVEQQQQRTTFIQGITGFLEQAGQIVAAQPIAAPLMGQLLMFGARGFRIGRDLDDALEEFVKQAEAMAAQPKPPQPDPAMAKVQAGAQVQQAKIAADAQADQQRLAMEDQQHQRELGQEAQLTTLKAHLDQQAQDQQAARDAQTQQHQAMLDATLARFEALLEAKTKIEVAEITAGATVDAAQISGAQQATE